MGALLFPAAVASKAAGRAKPLASVRVAPPAPVTASARFVTLRGTVRGTYRRSFTVQRRTNGAWRTIRTFRGGPRWQVRVRLTSAPTSLRVVLRTAKGPVRSRAVQVRVLAPTPPRTVPRLDEHDAERDRILRDSNALRARHGLPPLLPMAALQAIATQWSQQMASASAMSHNPHYWRQYPAGARSGAENVAFGYPLSQIVTAWSQSPPHRANLLGDFNRIGIGYAVDRFGVPWYTQNFAKY